MIALCTIFSKLGKGGLYDRAFLLVGALVWTSRLLRAHPVPTGDRDSDLKAQSSLAYSIANLAHGVTKVCEQARHPNPGPLFELLAERGLQVTSYMTAQSVANLAWALATAEHKAPILFDALAKHALNIMPTLIAQNVANMAWAFSKAEHKAPILFDALAKHALNIMPTVYFECTSCRLTATSKKGI